MESMYSKKFAIVQNEIKEMLNQLTLGKHSDFEVKTKLKQYLTNAKEKGLIKDFSKIVISKVDEDKMNINVEIQPLMVSESFVYKIEKK